MTRLRTLEVTAFPETALKTLAAQVTRTTQWQITLQDGVMMVSTGADCVSVEPDTWCAPRG